MDEIAPPQPKKVGYELKPSHYRKVQRERIIGLDLVLDEVDRLVDFQRRFGEYSILGARAPVGVLFNGPKGTGKTLTAGYLATQSESLFVNRDEQKCDIKDIFAAAREHVKTEKKPVIIFQDEFDKKAIEKEYPAGWKDTKEGNELLKVLDGIEGSETNHGILYIGTANVDRDALEMPLFRAGRLEVLTFYPPTSENRKKLLDLFIKEFTLTRGVGTDVDTGSLAQLFSDEDSPAEIEAIVRDAYRNTIRRHLNQQALKTLTTEDVYREIIKRKVRDRVSIDMTEEEQLITAVHELGHERVAKAVGIKVPFVSVIPTVAALGQTYFNDPRKHVTIEEAEGYVSTLMAGYLAENLFMGRGISYGSLGDIERVEHIVKGEGFKKGGIVRIKVHQHLSSDNTKALIEKEKRRMVEEKNTPFFQKTLFDRRSTIGEDDLTSDILWRCRTRAEEILKEYQKERFVKAAKSLAEKKTLFPREIDKMLEVTTAA